MDFMASVKARIVSHDFNPICIEASSRKIRHRKTNHDRYVRLKNDPHFKEVNKKARKKYRAKPDVKAHNSEYMKDWRAKKPPEWRESERERLKKYKTKPKKEPNNGCT